MRRASIGEVVSILTALRVTGVDKEKLISLAGDSSGTWVGVGAGVSQQLSAISAYEAEAASIAELQISVVPGLLQTSEYSCTLLSTSPLGSAERERGVFTRVGRQSVLSRPTLSTYRAFIDEAAFQRVVGSQPTMVGQLEHLIRMGRGSGKTIRVLPFSAGAYWGCEGAFILYGFSTSGAVVYQENQSSGVFVEDVAATKVYEQVLENLHNVALLPPESEELIAQYIERYQSDVSVS